jgi:dTDP-4-amino-4,6-dideoxygalactose transaminase
VTLTTVPVLDLARRNTRFAAPFALAVDRVVRSGHVLLGPELEAFESAFASFTGHRHCVGVASGAAALQLALVAMGVGPGDEVIVPAFTAVPTASAVCAIGAVPVPVDVDQATAALDPRAVAAAVTDRTSAIIPVHLYGRPAPLDDIAGLGIPVLEDAAQAHGAIVHGPSRSTAGGARSIATTYSFYPTKNLGGIGDGGVIVTDDDAVATLLRRLRVHGMSAQYVHTEISQNFRMSELEAAWLAITLPALAADNARRRVISSAYRSTAPTLTWHADHPDHVHHLCVVRSTSRDADRARLAAAGVATGVHYPLAITQQPAYLSFARDECPQAEAWAAQCVSLPCFPEMTDTELAQVADALVTVLDP